MRRPSRSAISLRRGNCAMYASVTAFCAVTHALTLADEMFSSHRYGSVARTPPTSSAWEPRGVAGYRGDGPACCAHTVADRHTNDAANDAVIVTRRLRCLN